MTATYYTRRTPDYSPLLVHFTRSGPERKMVREGDIPPEHPLHSHKSANSIDRLESILKARIIFASPMPSTGDSSAVCFTECVWDALMAQTDRYSSYGVVFSKRTVFQAGGGPALYVRGDILQDGINELPEAIKPFVVPFDPNGVIQPGVIQDWIHEREWRLPRPMAFEYSDVEYVLVESIADADRIMLLVGTINLPAHRFIPMEVYRSIRRAWGSQ